MTQPICKQAMPPRKPVDVALADFEVKKVVTVKGPRGLWRPQCMVTVDDVELAELKLSDRPLHRFIFGTSKYNTKLSAVIAEVGS